MAKTLNRVQLIGNLGADPEVKQVGQHKKATIRVATSIPGYTAKDGTKVEEKTTWHQVGFWNKLAEIVEKYLHKGSRVYVEGSIFYREYEKDGIKRYATEIEAENLIMMDDAPKTQQQPTAQPTMSQGVASAVQTLNNAGLQVEATDGGDLPF